MRRLVFVLALLLTLNIAAPAVLAFPDDPGYCGVKPTC